MFKTKEVSIFDTSRIKAGDFVTIAVMPNDQPKDSVEYVEVEEYRFNAIVHSVSEKYIQVITHDRTIRTIDIDRVINAPMFSGTTSSGNNKYKILGLQKDAIPKAPKLVMSEGEGSIESSEPYSIYLDASQLNRGDKE